MKKNCALIVAAGKGKRMGTEISKQFIEVSGNPVLYYTMEAFSKNSLIDEIYVVLSKEYVEYFKENILTRYKFKKPVYVVEGGKERQDSVYNGLAAIKNCEIVLIHDGARPFIEQKIIEEGINTATKFGASTCGVSPKDTIKIKSDEGYSAETLDRSQLFAVQTPQCFKYDIIFECHNKIKNNNIVVTDDTMVVEKYGYKVYLFDGSYKNIKITTPEDIIFAEAIINSEAK